MKPEDDANEVAVEQAKALLGRLPGYGDAPWFVFDAGYDPVKLQRGLEGCRAQLLVWLHSNRCFYADPEHPSPKPVGRPRRHGKKFDFKAPGTWPTPSAEHSCHDGDYGSVRVGCWAGLHPTTRRIGERYGCEAAPVVRGTVVLVEVERLPRETRKPKKLWLWWNGVAESDLDLLWRANCHRFDLEHTIRFLKQTLGWTTLRVRHPEQADRWTWLILAAYAQLRLAQVMVADKRLPWERRYPAERLTPLRALRSFATLCRFWAHRRGARNLVAGLQGAPKASFPGNRRGKPRRAMVRYQGQLYLRSIHPLVVGEAPKPLRAVE